jgi:hypothetical protein
MGGDLFFEGMGTVFDTNMEYRIFWEIVRGVGVNIPARLTL